MIDADKGQLIGRAAYQLGLARAAVGNLVRSVEQVGGAVGGMVPDDFHQQ